MLYILEKLRSAGFTRTGFSQVLSFALLFFLICNLFLDQLSLHSGKMVAVAPACTLLGPILWKKGTHSSQIKSIRYRKH